MTKHRLDTPDTLDAAIRILTAAQADGWGLDSVEYSVDYGQPGSKARRIPVAATITVRLRP